MATASLDGALVDVSRPGIGHAAPVGKVHHCGSQDLVARPAEHGSFVFAGLACRGTSSGQACQSIVGGEALPAISDLAQQAGGAHGA